MSSKPPGFTHGSVSQVVPPAELAATALSVARVIAGKSPLAPRLAKQVMNRVEHPPREDRCRLEQDYTARVSRFDDALKAAPRPPGEAGPELDLARRLTSLGTGTGVCLAGTAAIGKGGLL
jgi:hypothetical protein